MELEMSLVEVVDADALDDLFDGAHRRASDDGLLLTIFTFCGCEVTAYDDGKVTATRLDKRASVTSNSGSKASLRR
ncbi:HalOD1 output domain-containing protein [Haloprofundus sp. MHR1]|uniref:HalOD1 output domain-containing protein n=2 Tax=Haloprofundus TaxID=1911573 RepID=UPI000E443EC9|nr:HalOD1 output domain-containing protein [Haloprofundus sp. MHR1]QCJ47126.1 hypothetical protein FCF25_08370 [Haloprofundus sp. MHR1]